METRILLLTKCQRLLSRFPGSQIGFILLLVVPFILVRVSMGTRSVIVPWWGVVGGGKGEVTLRQGGGKQGEVLALCDWPSSPPLPPSSLWSITHLVVTLFLVFFCQVAKPQLCSSLRCV